MLPPDDTVSAQLLDAADLGRTLARLARQVAVRPTETPLSVRVLRITAAGEATAHRGGHGRGAPRVPRPCGRLAAERPRHPKATGPPADGGPASGGP